MRRQSKACHRRMRTVLGQFRNINCGDRFRQFSGCSSHHQGIPDPLLSISTPQTRRQSAVFRSKQCRHKTRVSSSSFSSRTSYPSSHYFKGSNDSICPSMSSYSSTTHNRSVFHRPFRTKLFSHQQQLSPHFSTQRQHQQQQRYNVNGPNGPNGPNGGSNRQPKQPLHAEEDSYIDQAILEKSKDQQTGVSLHQMFEMGRSPSPTALLQNAQFLWKELPIRLAKRVVELRSLPYGLSRVPSIEAVTNIYVESFEKIRRLPKPLSNEEEEQFSEIIRIIMDNHSNVVPMVAQGLMEMRREFDAVNFPLDDCPYLADFLNRFYMARIGIRFLIGHHVELHRSRNNPHSSFVGIIDGECQPSYISEDAVNDASRVCQQALGDYPEVNIHDPHDVTCRYVSTHLHFMLFELLKNSMRAVVEYHAQSDHFPPIDIIIADGAKEISIKVSDEGGGIKRRDIHRILSYTYTTARLPMDQDAVGRGLISAPMAGFGYGLPISRLYANYFGGDLRITSMDGYGTDAYISLLKLGDYNETLN